MLEDIYYVLIKKLIYIFFIFINLIVYGFNKEFNLI